DFHVTGVQTCALPILRRIGEGAAMMRTKGEPGTGDVVEAVRHARSVYSEIRRLTYLPEEEVMTFAKNIQAPYELCLQVRELGARSEERRVGNEWKLRE